MRRFIRAQRYAIRASMAKSTPEAPVKTVRYRIEPTKTGFVLILIPIAIAWVAMQLIPVVLVVVASLFLVGTLNPAVESLEKRGWKRGRAIGLVFAVLF